MIKGLIIVRTVLIALVPFWVPNELDSWNFQHMLLFSFREASQNLSLFRQLFFHSFQGGTKGKMLKNCHNYTLVFQHFSFGPPLETMKKKSCINKLKFWEASRNQKRSICWKFKLSISLGTQKSAKTPLAVGKMIRPF